MAMRRRPNGNGKRNGGKRSTPRRFWIGGKRY